MMTKLIMTSMLIALSLSVVAEPALAHSCDASGATVSWDRNHSEFFPGSGHTCVSLIAEEDDRTFLP